MKFGYLCHAGIFGTGGPGGRTADLLGAVAGLGHQVHVRTECVPRSLGAVRHAPDDEGLTSMAQAVHVCLVRLDGSCHAERLAERMREVRPELPIVLEIHAPLEEQLSYTIADQRERQVRQDWIVRGNAVRRGLAAGGAPAICVSEGMARYARDALGIERTLVSPNAADPQRFTPRRPPSGPFTALWTGSARYVWQAADLVVEAAKRAEEIGFLLACPDDGGLPSGLPANVKTVVGTAPEAMDGVYERAHVALVLYHEIPGSHWGFYASPLKLYEALAAGVPVIGSDLGQISETIGNVDCGRVVDGCPDAIAAALRELASDPARASEMSGRARLRAEARGWREAAVNVVEFCTQAGSPN